MIKRLSFKKFTAESKSTSAEDKRRHDDAQRKLAVLAKERRLAKEAGKAWKANDKKEKEYYRLKDTMNEEVQLNEAKKDHFVYQKDSQKAKEVVHRGSEQSSKEWIEKNAKHYSHKGRGFDIYKGTYPNVKPSDKIKYSYVAESVELDEGSNAVKNTVAKIDKEISVWERRWKKQLASIHLGNGVGNIGDAEAPEKIKDLKAKKAALMKKHGIKEEVELDEAQIDKMNIISKGFKTRPEAERHNDRLVAKKAASHKSYVDKNSDGKFYVVDMKESVELDEVSNAVKDTLAGIDLSIRDWEKRWKNKSAGNPNDMKAPMKIKDLKAQKAALMKKHGIKESVDLDDVQKEYRKLKKKPIGVLRKMVLLQNKAPIIMNDYDKEGAISDLLRIKFGEKKVKAAGLNKAKKGDV